ncbi:MAG TPA: hypothetical protein VG317_17990 [Pseudonocardiaceae bacterium]|jgi:flagellar motor component MotA|nr:hypothetical protein [Pseudonocardiaceae bacterium]
MRKTVVGAIAVVTATSVISMAGVGLANAASMLQPSAGSTESAVAFSPGAEAQNVQVLHDQLKTTFNQKDVSAVLTTVDQLSAELTKLRSPAAHTALSPSASTLSTKAQRQDIELKTQLDAGIADAVPATGLLDAVTGLISSLLTTLLSLISSLLGGLPVPGVGGGGGGGLPVPLPTGGLPTGGLPTGGLPVSTPKVP